ncbi:hypothetical protein OXX69_001177 [Metschnikowia pulcherrima]
MSESPFTSRDKLTQQKDAQTASITQADSVASTTGKTVYSSNIAPNRFVILLTLASSISGFMFGYDTGYISAALVQVGTDLSNKVLTSGEKELITSATSLGAFFGAILGGVLANLIGRKKVLLGSNIFFYCRHDYPTCCKNCSDNDRWSVCAWIWCRGRLIVTNCIFITGGQLVAYFINWGLTRVAHGWRVSVGLCMVPAVLQSVLFFFLPDTPRFYVIKGDYARAKAVYFKTESHATEEMADAVVSDMISSNSTVPGGPLGQIWKSIKLIHTNSANFRALILACGLQGIQQFTGFNSLMYFSTTIFETIGFKNPTAVSIIIAATNFVFTLIALCIIDIVGRRRILLFAVPGMCVSLILCAIAFHFLGITFNSNAEVIVKSSGITGWGIVIIIGMVLFVASYAIGIGNSAWTGVELFSDVNVRSVGGMYAAATNWAGSLVIASTFLTMLENITPPGTFAFFACLCFISFLFIFFLLPDVAGLELEQTTELLEGGFNVKKAGKMSREARRLARIIRSDVPV